MSNTETKDSKATFLHRVYENDALRKGIAAAVAGLVVAVATEAIWGSSE